jgi:8-oxo-dGTP pyrophosphatase MutT (NUDIX family)
MASNASVLCVVHAMIVVGEAVLLLRRAGTGRADGLWAPPGGHLEAGELPTPDPAVTDAADLFPIAEPPVPHLPWIPGALARLSGRGEPYGEYPAP